MSNGSRVLYLSYDGMTDPLGQSQVLPYLTRLAGLGHSITLLSFEKPQREDRRAAVLAQCHAAGLEWLPLRYTKRPPVLSTMHDVRRMSKLAERAHRAQPFDLVHCRSYVPALAGLRLERRTGVPFLFDMRGLWADERVDGGLWNLRNPLYRAVYAFFKRKEREFLRRAAAVVSLTYAARDHLQADGASDTRIEVIPCCADLQAFRPVQPEDRAAARRRLNIPPGARVAAYLGSLGTWYLLGEMLDAFAVQRSWAPDARMLWITPDDPALIHAAATRRGLPPESLVIRSAERAEVPGLMAAADYGLFFIKPAFSKIASSPVKLGEMMALGLPVLTNRRIGDVDRILAESGAGVTVKAFSHQAYRTALDRLEDLRLDQQRWHAAIRRWFDLDEGVRRYDALYRDLSRDTLRKPPRDTP